MRIYENVEQKCRRFTIVLMKLGMVSGAIGVFMPTFVLSLVAMLMGNHDASTWFFPTKYLVPFDSTTIVGFYSKLAMYAVYGLNSYYLVILTAIGYFVSCCYYLNAFCEYFQLMFNEIDQIACHRCISAKETNEINNRLKKAVEFHKKIFE